MRDYVEGFDLSQVEGYERNKYYFNLEMIFKKISN